MYKTNCSVEAISQKIYEQMDVNHPSLALPRRPFLLAIDGRCGSGKTMLANTLKNELSLCRPLLRIELFHMDDFFPRPEQRTAERLRTPGGNVDHERFFDEVLANLKANKAFSYRPFDCTSMALSSPVCVLPSHIAIIEGSYSLHPELRDQYDLKVFLDIDPQEQKQRILKRNGEEKLIQFIEKWILFEELYFDSCNVREIADMLFN